MNLQQQERRPGTLQERVGAPAAAETASGSFTGAFCGSCSKIPYGMYGMVCIKALK